jgi:cell division protein FtsI/penicillin-binding protein 2
MDKHLRHNSSYVKLVFSLLILVLIVQLFRIQVLQHDKWLARSSIRNEYKKTYSASRGIVYFSDGTPLAINQPVYGVFAVTDNFESKKAKQEGITKEKFAESIESIFKLEKKIILERLSSQSAKYISIVSKISEDDLTKLKALVPEDSGVWTVENQVKRVYPNKLLASKLIGFVGKDDEGNDIGRYGIEEYFDGVLKGTEGIFEGKKDSQNNIIANENFESITSKNGIDITLTIDKGVQAILEERLLYWLDRFKAKEVTGVIMEPNTGRILASANLPTYDPNEYWKGEKIDCSLEYYSVLNAECNKAQIKEETKSTEVLNEEGQIFYPEGYVKRLKELEEEKQRILKEAGEQNANSDLNILTDADKQKLEKYPERVREILRKSSLPYGDVYRNSANSFTYEPGSVEKVITLAIAYNANTISRDPNYQLGAHQGCEKVADVTLCTSTKKPKSSLTVREMLRDSDNIGAMRVADKVPTQDFIATLSKFGLGKQTGVELADETVYPIKDPQSWSIVDKYTASYGQGSISLTPIQLTRTWNILASGGKSFKPTLLKEINDNGSIKQFEPVFEGNVINEQAALDALRINSLANADSFKLARDFYAKFPFSGKTGTANIPKSNGAGYLDNVVNTSFIGIAPSNKPKFTMLIWFREPRLSADADYPNGANTSETAWLDIAERLMFKFNIAPQK